MASQTAVIATASVAAVATGVLAYAVYFDYRRRNQADFRRELRREKRRQVRVEKEVAEADAQQQRRNIRLAVDAAKAEGLPQGLEEKEQYFLDQVQVGEALSADPSRVVDAALAFYRALKVYPTPGDLIGIYDKTVSKPILDVLAEMIAYDGTLDLEAFATGSFLPSQGSRESAGAGYANMPTVGLD